MKIMKMKFMTGIMLLLAFVATGCSEDDDYTIHTGEIITNIESVSATVSSTGATVKSIVQDLSGMSSTSYTIGVCYSTTKDSTAATSVAGTLSSDTLTTSITGLETGVTYYYWTYVTLQSKVTRYSTCKQLITTDAEIATADPINTEVTATLSGALTISTEASDEVVKGIRISLDQASATSGRLYSSDETDGNVFTISLSGLVPSQTYYYVAYASVNGSEKFGEVKSFTTADQDVDFVDLGLSVEWATVNVGAASPEQAGGLYGYGDNTLFNISTQASDYANTDIQATGNDIASMYIDAAFTPTKAQFEELLSGTTHEYTTENGVAGYRFTASNGNSIFLPLTGTRIGETVSSADALGAYWSASVDAVDSEHATALSFTESGVSVSSSNLYEGLAIRPVRMPNRVMNLEYLYKTWCIDLDADGNCVLWDGPLYYYGTDDSWNTVTNGWSITGDVWNWCPSYADNSWIATAADHGTMTFNSDGTVVVNDLGNGTQYSGTFTVDEDNHTITLTGAEILHLENFDALVSNWSTSLKIMSLTEDGLQIAALRDLSDEGECLLVHNYVNSSLVGGNGKSNSFDNSKLLFGDLEANGNLRLELYNAYGSSASDPAVNSSNLSFSSNLAVTFKLSGVTLNDGAAGAYNAALSFASSDWGVQYWGGTPKYDALVSGDGEYTVFMETSAQSTGATVFCIDISGMASDIADMSAVSAEIVSITTDANTENLYTTVPVDNSKILFVNKDGNGTDGRVEIYNEYGDTKADPGISQSDLNFSGRMTITFTVSGITGNLKDGATGSYKSEISYADASWDPSYWGGSALGYANVTGDGTYTVYADMGTGVCEGAVVFCIEMYGLWADLVDTSKVSVTIDEIATEAIK